MLCFLGIYSDGLLAIAVAHSQLQHREVDPSASSKRRRHSQFLLFLFLSLLLFTNPDRSLRDYYDHADGAPAIRDDSEYRAPFYPKPHHLDHQQSLVYDGAYNQDQRSAAHGTPYE